MRFLQPVAVLLLSALIGFFVLSTSGPESSHPIRLGLDLAGGTELVYRADTATVIGDASDSLNSLRDVIERRINVFGVAEPLVQIEKGSAVAGSPEDRLLVELPGVTDVQAAVDAIGKTPLLEFKLLAGEFVEGEEPTFTSTALTGRYLKNAELQFGTGQGGTLSNEPVVVLNFTDEGSKLFAEITSKNIGKTLAIFLDGQPISTPVIREAITAGTATISGGFTPEGGRDLVRNLNFGALPVPITLLSSSTVGPTLGEAAYADGVNASIIGFILVSLFMILWYRVPGVVATIALLIYVLITIAIIKFIPITLTSSGIAGFILSIGMAVDANVLIFERLKEELRAGKQAREAMLIGFARAWSAIRDGHLTMLISSAILFWLGTSLVQGFALVFGFGVIVSLISAVMISRVFLSVILPEKMNRTWKFLLGSGFSFTKIKKEAV